MTRRIKIILGIVGVALCLYLGAYFASVRTDYQLAITGHLRPEPVYRPWDASVIRALFVPAHLLDAAYFRPAHWDMQPLPPRESR